MKKRLRNKIAKEVLGVTKIKVKKGECLLVEVDENTRHEQLENISHVLKSALKCRVIVSTKKVNLTVIDEA